MSLILPNSYLLYPSAPPGGGGLAGYTTFRDVFSSSASSNTRNGTILGAVAGELIVLGTTFVGDTATDPDPSSWSVTVGGSAATFHIGRSQGSVFPGVVIHSIVVPSSGDLAVSMTFAASTRAAVCKGLRLTGFNSVTPIAGADSNGITNTDVTTLDCPNSYSPNAVGNVIFGIVSVKSGATSAGAWGVSTDAELWLATGGSTTSDHYSGFMTKVVPDLTTMDYAVTWTGANRVNAAWVEIAKE